MPALDVFLVSYLPNWQMRLAFTLVGRRETERGRKQLQGKAEAEVPSESTEVDMTCGAQEELGIKSSVTGIPARLSSRSEGGFSVCTG